MMRFALPALLLAAPAAAQDVQAWTTLQAQGPVNGKLLLWAELQPRFTNDADRLGQFLGRAALGVRLKNNVELHAGYAYAYTSPAPGIRSDEHRLWQQVQAPVLRRENGFAVTTRWRLEQRMIEGARDLGWRIRMQWTIHQPLGGPGTGGPVLASETFAALNSTDWGARGGFDQQRSFAGWLQPLGGQWALQAGYLHQYVRRRGPDAGNHVLNLTLTRRLG